MLSKIQLNDKQITLVKAWLPSDSYPYAYDPTKGIVWFWQISRAGPIKNATKLDPDQLCQLNQLTNQHKPEPTST